jgi:tetratricopeptide (TPR) repeat protein
LSGIGLATGGNRPEETSRAVRRLFEALGRERPLAVLLDDLQWAEPTFLDLVEHMAVLSADSSIVLLCLARPELLDERPRWNEDLQNATTLRLEPLTDDEAGALMTNLLEGDRLDEDVRHRIASAAAGNPLFVEQMLAMLSEAPDGNVAIPPTIQALLAARLDRLEPDERSLLECASVVGKEFWHGIVAELGSDAAVLPALVRKELIRPHRATAFAADDAYQFRHDLIRDAAYAEIPKERRAALHERCAVWLEGHLAEHDEIVGYHLEQAHDYRTEVGDVDEHTRTLGVRAGRLLGAAGLRAADRSDIPATINLLTRAATLLPGEDARVADLLVHLGYAHIDAGAVEDAVAAFADARERAANVGLAALASRASVGRAATRFDTGERVSAILEDIRREIENLRRLEDPIGLAEAYREAAKGEASFGRTEEADRLFERAVTNARLSGSRRVESDIIVWRLAIQCWGYLPAGAGIRTTTALLEEGKGGLGDAFALVVRGRYRAMQGDLAGGRADMAAGRALIREFGADYYVAGSGQEHAMLELESDDPAAAEDPARESYELSTRMHPGGTGGASFLARSLIEQGRLDEGARVARIVEENSPPDEIGMQSDWRYLKASVLSKSGELEPAYALAREAVALAGQTDYLEFHAQALLVLADVLTLRGEPEKARDALEEAVRVYARKESVFGVARARSRLRDLAGESLAERS